jgi:hypothetical protein
MIAANIARKEDRKEESVSHRVIVIAVLTPTVCPFMRAKQQMIFFAKVGIISNTEKDIEIDRARGRKRARKRQTGKDSDVIVSVRTKNQIRSD